MTLSSGLTNKQKPSIAPVSPTRAGHAERPLRPLRGAVWFATCVLLLVSSLGCPGGKPCQKHFDCKVGQRCNESGTCEKGCGSDLDCKDGEVCNPTLRKCGPRDCARGGVATASGCLCDKDSDCKANHRCVPDEENKNRCRPICEPDGTTPSSPGDRCTCLEGWSLAGPANQQRCYKDCPSAMARLSNLRCEPKLDSQLPKMWGRSQKGRLRQKCRDGVSLDDDERCNPTAPKPLAAGPKVGPQKSCPADASDKWDEEYANRAGLPKDTKLIYVDAAAKSLGTGDKSLPFSELDRALRAAKDGDVLLLAPGAYPWGQTIANRVHLVGRCPSKVSLVAKASDTAPGITVTAVGVTIDGLTLEAKGLVDVGIDLTGATSNAKLRHVVVKDTLKTGVAIAGKGMIVTQSQISQSRDTGILIGASTSSARIELSSVDGCENQGILVSIPDPTPRAEIDIQSNDIVDNRRTGVEIRGAMKRIQLTSNAIKKNGAKSDVGAVLINLTKGKAILEKNLIEENQPFGMLAQNVDQLEVSGNHLAKNVNASTFSAGLWIVKARFLQLSGNVIRQYGSTGIRIDDADDLTIVGNWIEDAQQDNPVGAGISLQPGGGKGPPSLMPLVRIQDNVVRGHKQVGIFVNGTGEKVEISGNDVRDSGKVGIQVGGPRRGFEHKMALVMKGNNLSAGALAAALVIDVDTATIEANAVFGTGRNGAGIAVFDSRRVDVKANVLRGLRNGMSLRRIEQLTVVQNVVDGPSGTKESASTGISVEACEKELTIENNAVFNADRGGLVRLLPADVTASLRGNVWARNRSVGLAIRDNAGRLKVEGEIFEENGGRHLVIQNQKGLVTLLGSGFARAKASDANVVQGWGKSAGNGVYIGAKGLVRWVFSRDALPCDKGAKALGVALDEGWYARPIRVPYELDICRRWIYDSTKEGGTFRSDDARKMASACSDCYKKDMGCRWVWKQTKVSGSPSRNDVWKPDSVECVVRSKPDTCVRPPQGAPSHLPVLRGPAMSVGQCVKLDKKPCAANGFCGNDTSKTDYCSREQRFTPDATTANSFCAIRALRGPCHPDRPSCTDNQSCVATRRISLALDATPASVTLKQNAFWQNPGPDVVMDQPGRVLFEANFLVPCSQSKSCTPRTTYRRGEGGWEKVLLPDGKSLIWQRPSPFPQAAYQSRLNGNPTENDHPSKALLHTPSFCQAYDFH